MSAINGGGGVAAAFRRYIILFGSICPLFELLPSVNVSKVFQKVYDRAVATHPWSILLSDTSERS